MSSQRWSKQIGAYRADGNYKIGAEQSEGKWRKNEADRIGARKSRRERRAVPKEKIKA